MLRDLRDNLYIGGRENQRRANKRQIVLSYHKKKKYIFKAYFAATQSRFFFREVGQLNNDLEGFTPPPKNPPYSFSYSTRVQSYNNATCAARVCSHNCLHASNLLLFPCFFFLFFFSNVCTFRSTFRLYANAPTCIICQKNFFSIQKSL